nr:MAG TPA: hypothetical protein [Caudoviricetes sp.]
MSPSSHSYKVQLSSLKVNLFRIPSVGTLHPNLVDCVVCRYLESS